MHLMMSLKFISALYKAETLELFFIPLFRGVVADELKGEMQAVGAKMQLAEVMPTLLLNVLAPEDRTLRQTSGSVSASQVR